MNSQHKVAQQLQQQGRGDDDVLVHMNRKELMGLEALARQHGLALTRNPKTGLSEAGVLSSLLPIAAGVLGSMWGMPWLGVALGAGAGALTNKDNPLMGGIMGGLGGWGGAGLAGALGGAGAGAAAAEAAAAENAAALAVPTTAASSAAAQGAAALESMGLSGADMGLFNSALPAELANTVGSTASIDPWLQTAAQSSLPSSQMAEIAARVGPEYQQFGLTSGTNYSGADYARGLEAWKDAPMQALKDNYKYGMAALAPMMMDPYGSGSVMSSEDAQKKGRLRPYTYTPGDFWRGRSPYYTAGPITPLAGGGIAGLARGGRSHPRMINGPGTGLSDSIPASINGQQPAALADGEFVIPADVVSALGGGSTNSGARALYSMMDRIRSQAHGNKKQIRKVNTRKALPA